MARHTLALTALLLAACTGKDDDDTPAEVEAAPLGDCDPIAPTQCGLPFPSTFYMREDPDSATGWRVHLGETTLPENANFDQPAPTYWNERDGWSPLTPMIAHFPGASLDGVVGHDDLGASLDDDSKTLVVDVDTGERVPHFAELDLSHDDDTRRAFLIRPVTPMAYGHHYAVGVRGLVDSAGAAIAPSDAFLALRDGNSSDDTDVEGRRDHYDDVVFPALESQGWARAEVQLAWDFVVGSRDGITGKAVWMRDDTLDRVGTAGPAYEITSIEEYTVEENANTARRVYGTMTVPLYTEEDHGGTPLTRGDDGLPYYNGDAVRKFTVIIPQSLVADPHPAPVLQYGHGLLGDQGEVEGGYLAELANRNGWILFAVDWTGMRAEDALSITTIIATDLGRFAELPERSQQGFIEFMAAMRLVTGDLASDEALSATDSEGTLVSLVDPERRYYYGNSQGGILGGAYMALTPDISRGVLGVTGMPYALLLDRSEDFAPFFQMFRTMYPDPLQVMLWLAQIQTLWDSGEPSGYGLALTQDPLPGVEAKQMLLQVAIGDRQVSTLGAHVMARAYGAKLLDSPVREVWGVESVAGPWEGSALVEWDYGLSEPTENVPPEGEDPHEWPRRELLAQEQLTTFLETGVIENTCGGPCEGTPQ